MNKIALLLGLLLAESVVADDIIIVLDTSGSMSTRMQVGETRMKVAQNALTDVLTKLPPTTHIGLITFDGWAYKLGPINKEQITAAIKATTASKSHTPLWQYIKYGADALLQERQKNNNVGRYKLVVVTDGEANDSENNYLTDIKNRGLIVDAIGMDMRSDHSLKNKVNGYYMRGDDPSSLTESVGKAVAEKSFSDAATGDEKEALEMIAAMPDKFSLAVVQGLSLFQNQPIGEKPPLVSVDADTGNVVVPAAAPVAAAPEEGGSGILWLGIVIVGAAIVFFIWLANQ